MVGQDVQFIDDDAPQTECMTVSGPKSGLPCQLPFRFQGKLRTACLKEEDQEDRFWCSTLVDDERNHVPNQENWGYCSESCPIDSTGTEVPNPEGRNFEFTNDIEGSPCTTLTGELGVCHLPSSCVGVTISFLETNECVLKDSTTGVCCLDITENNIVDIVDTAADVVDIPEISVEEADDFLRSGFFEVNDDDVEENVLAADGVNFGFEDSPAEDPEDTGPTEFHLRFNTPRKDIISVDKDAQVLLEATKLIQESNNLTDEQLNEIHKILQVYRTFDGTCNSLKEPNFGRTGTPFQRILLPEYAQGTVDIPRKRANSNFELPSAREVSNGLAGVSNQMDSDNTVLVMQMGQFIDHDITHTPNHGIQCCANNGQFPSSFDPTKCFPIR
ncbi:chorion peroxidase [Eurytemora carolleeae]|uniref:chorion peroxidase n=1 Tax=Eurytemora carolleeae TaxID=1294199 RepID=UPI000C766498|nr:chorion peroxidase [Eurytemora carolleeae]|eukprot:XP_023345416.1 chorion peroxidase-like [Eurytemora affinis]